MTTEFKLYKSPKKSLLIFAYTLPFVIIGLCFIFSDLFGTTHKLIGWFSVLFFGLGIPVGLFHLFDRRPQIIINTLGIYDRTSYEAFINWDIINDAYLQDVHGQKFICLVIDESFAPSKRKGKWYKRSVSFNKVLGFQELNISLGQIKIDEYKFIEFIKAMILAESSARQEKLNYYLATP